MLKRVLTWETKNVAAAEGTAAAADVAETNRKHKVTPDWGDLIMKLLQMLYNNGLNTEFPKSSSQLANYKLW